MRLEINGERRELAEGLSLQELVQFLKLKPEQIAIELNQVVVRRAEWASTKLKEDDRVEIVYFVGGGCGQEQEAGGRRQGQEAGGRSRWHVAGSRFEQFRTEPSAPADCACHLPPAPASCSCPKVNSVLGLTGCRV